MENVRYISTSAEMEIFLNDQREAMRNAMANIRKATKADIALHEIWTAEQIFAEPPAIAVHRCQTVNDKIFWNKVTRVPMLLDFSTTSVAYQSGVPMHMVKHSDARLATALIQQEDYDSALEGPPNQFIPLKRLRNGLVPFVGLRILRALPFKLDLDEDFYDTHARRETQRQTLESVLHKLKAENNAEIDNFFLQTVTDIFGPRARLGPFLDSEGINTSTPAIYTTLKLPAECFIERLENVSATLAQGKADLFAHQSASDSHKTFLVTDAAGGSSATTSRDPVPTELMSAHTKEAEAVEDQRSTHESAHNQSSPQVEQPSTVSSNTEHPEDHPIAGERGSKPEESTSPEPAPTQAAAPAQAANTTTSKCMLPNCPRPMNRAEVRRTHLVTHYAKWRGMPAVERVYGGNWAASNDAQDAIIVPWLRGLGLDPDSIKLNGEVVFKG
ncbi:hypothetical protein KC332_g1322 [Hortaea werneckii]|nr:hypothetical protein KC358_g667 [Hortaea werneckii]KAI6852664.1 hypothetical protein KC350_g703 [Hortaea werneckii]KAI6943799.1 hypothetical protein KC341_g1268 [Hortaea werneckii]KAI6950431.1 hypothetical protein KC348_g698 [Hortaea werneckii]KAI6982596.1 hypothetical protein KC321_g559 [Hortaea werneckii]